MSILVPFVVACLATFYVSPWVMRLAKRYKLIDDPKLRYHPAHTHVGVIPRAGGLAIYIGIMTGIVLFLPASKVILGLAIAATVLTAVGLSDDRRDISPFVRLGTNALATIIAISGGIGIPFMTNPITGGVLHLDTFRIVFNFFGTHSVLVWADLLAFIWIMWTMNIIGWSAGVDGQMPGFVAIAAIVIGILSLRFSLDDPSQFMVTILAFIVAGSFIGFLPWNYYPQKIMPGYGGKTLAGFFLAVLGILSYAKLGTALLVLGVPTIDAVYTIIRRFGSKRSLVKADRGHLHHKLLDLGWDKRHIALFYWILSAILGLISLLVNSRQKVFTFLVIFVVIGGFFLWVNFFMQLSKPQDRDNG